MAHPNTRIPTEKTARRDFETGTVQPGPGMAPAQPPAEDMKDPGNSEEFQMPGSQEKKNAPANQQNPSKGGCGCG